MNSEQISQILNRALGPKIFGGVYAANEIPQKFLQGPFPNMFVVNTDKYGQPGKHWQAIFILGKNKLEFFDSFGEAPVGDISNFTKNFPNLKVNKVRVQANYELSCGPHVIYFLINRSRGISFENIIKALTDNKFKDTYVKFFVHSLVKKFYKN